MEDIKESASPPFEKEDLVWAKIMGFPWWPAVVSDIESRDDGRQTIVVNFFGENSHARLPPKKVAHFLDYYEEYSRQGKGKSFKAAVIDAINVIKEEGTKIPEDIDLNLPEDIDNTASTGKRKHEGRRPRGKHKRKKEEEECKLNGSVTNTVDAVKKPETADLKENHLNVEPYNPEVPKSELPGENDKTTTTKSTAPPPKMNLKERAKLLVDTTPQTERKESARIPKPDMRMRRKAKPLLIKSKGFTKELPMRKAKLGANQKMEDIPKRGRKKTLVSKKDQDSYSIKNASKYLDKILLETPTEIVKKNKEVEKFFERLEKIEDPDLDSLKENELGNKVWKFIELCSKNSELKDLEVAAKRAFGALKDYVLKYFFGREAVKMRDRRGIIRRRRKNSGKEKAPTEEDKRFRGNVFQEIARLLEEKVKLEKGKVQAKARELEEKLGDGGVGSEYQQKALKVINALMEVKPGTSIEDIEKKLKVYI